MNGSAMRGSWDGEVGRVGKGHSVPWNVTLSIWPWRIGALTFELCLVSGITWLAEWMNVRTFSKIFRVDDGSKGHVPNELKESQIQKRQLLPAFRARRNTTSWFRHLGHLVETNTIVTETAYVIILKIRCMLVIVMIRRQTGVLERSPGCWSRYRSLFSPAQSWVRMECRKKWSLVTSKIRCYIGNPHMWFWSHLQSTKTIVRFCTAHSDIWLFQ